ncbi:hypothetical protein [Bacillus sp. JJ1764]|uniref:hypothetical protein n=1 Tax=Bacillus sp. JJ1764 TaxID=3122964 RepID=UPI002FFE1236
MQQSARKVKNPDGFIRKAIRKNWSPTSTPIKMPRKQAKGFTSQYKMNIKKNLIQKKTNNKKSLSIIGLKINLVKVGVIVMSKYWYGYYPDGVISRYELLVFDCQNQPFLPLTEHYHDCLGRISKNSVLSYVRCLLPFFTWLDQFSNIQGNLVNWDDSPDIIRIAIEDYLMTEMACKVKEKDTFRFVNRTNKSPNTVNRFYQH